MKTVQEEIFLPKYHNESDKENVPDSFVTLIKYRRMIKPSNTMLNALQY